MHGPAKFEFSLFSFNFRHHLLSLRSYISCLRFHSCLPLTSLFSSIFPSITCFRMRFLHKMWPTQLDFLLFTVCRTFLSSKTLLNKRYKRLFTEEYFKYLQFHLIIWYLPLAKFRYNFLLQNAGNGKEKENNRKPKFPTLKDTLLPAEALLTWRDSLFRPHQQYCHISWGVATSRPLQFQVTLCLPQNTPRLWLHLPFRAECPQREVQCRQAWQKTWHWQGSEKKRFILWMGKEKHLET
jgi:hypothetical protein